MKSVTKQDINRCYKKELSKFLGFVKKEGIQRRTDEGWSRKVGKVTLN